MINLRHFKNNLTVSLDTIGKLTDTGAQIDVPIPIFRLSELSQFICLKTTQQPEIHREAEVAILRLVSLAGAKGHT